MIAAYVGGSIRAIVRLRRGTARVRFDWDGERHPIADSQANLDERLDALAAERPFETPDPDTLRGWGFDGSQQV